MPRKPNDVPIQVMLAEDSPLFQHLETARKRIGATRAGYLKRLLERDLLQQPDQQVSPSKPAVETPPSEAGQAVSPPPEPTIETDDDLLAGFLGE